MADFRWDGARGVYLDDGGTEVPEAAIRASLAALIAKGQARLAVHAQRLAAGEIDLLRFREAVGADLRAAHTAAGLLAHGGRQALEPSTRGYLGSVMRGQNSYLSGFALDWAQGRMTPAQMAARLAMYPEAIHSTYEAVRRRDAPARGHAEERNILGGAAAHCDGCLSATAAGWVPLGTLTPPGGRTCVSRCRCTLQTRAAPVAVEVPA